MRMPQINNCVTDINFMLFLKAVQLAIVADDGFYAEHRDEALVECIKSGSITDISVLMNGGVIRSSGSKPTQSVLLDYCKQSSFLPGLL